MWQNCIWGLLSLSLTPGCQEVSGENCRPGQNLFVEAPFSTVNNLTIANYHIGLSQFAALSFSSLSQFVILQSLCDYLVSVCLPYYTGGPKGQKQVSSFSFLCLSSQASGRGHRKYLLIEYSWRKGVFMMFFEQAGEISSSLGALELWMDSWVLNE